jgi:hypothetical protein
MKAARNIEPQWRLNILYIAASNIRNVLRADIERFVGDDCEGAR